METGDILRVADGTWSGPYGVQVEQEGISPRIFYRVTKEGRTAPLLWTASLKKALAKAQEEVDFSRQWNRRPS